MLNIRKNTEQIQRSQLEKLQLRERLCTTFRNTDLKPVSANGNFYLFSVQFGPFSVWAPHNGSCKRSHEAS